MRIEINEEQRQVLSAYGVDIEKIVKTGKTQDGRTVTTKRYYLVGDISDEMLVTLGKCGNKYACEVLLLKYKSKIAEIVSKKKYFFKIGYSRDDLVLEGMLGFYNAIFSFNSERNVPFLPFALTCAENKMKTLLDKANGIRHSINNDACSLEEHQVQDMAVNPFLSPEDIYLQRESRKVASRKLNGILSKMELKVVGEYISGLSVFEIAQKLGISRKDVENALHRARKKINGIKN